MLQHAGAQTFTQRLQKHTTGQGTVTLHQSNDIDELVNSATLGSQAAPAAARPQKGTASQAPNPSEKANTTAGNSSETAAPQDDGGQKVIRNGIKTTGYRIQAFAGGNSRKDRQQAMRTGENIKQHFPNVPVYVHFYSPRWICRVGNYRTMEEAHQMLVSLRNLGFSQATIIKTKITVAY